jgi:hypothetical protein
VDEDDMAAIPAVAAGPANQGSESAEPTVALYANKN